jgi:hypothetical protein
MATGSILGGAPEPGKPRGRDADALGPSDSSDSGSDVPFVTRTRVGVPLLEQQPALPLVTGARGANQLPTPGQLLGGESAHRHTVRACARSRASRCTPAAGRASNSSVSPDPLCVTARRF